MGGDYGLYCRFVAHPCLGWDISRNQLLLVSPVFGTDILCAVETSQVTQPNETVKPIESP